MGKVWDWIQKGDPVALPFVKRMFGMDKEDREKFAPQQQYWGGSEKASQEAQRLYHQGQMEANQGVRAGVTRTNDAADVASDWYRGMTRDAERRVGTSTDRMTRAAQDYNVGRTGSLANAQRLEELGQNAPQAYQSTAQSAFRSQQDANQRAALGMAAGRGAAGLRTALASSAVANQQAAQQAQITQAQEQNELLGMQQSAYGQAANIRQAQGAQDLSSAGLFAQREQAQQGLMGNAVAGNFGAQAGAGAQEVAAGTAARGQYLGAETSKGVAELNAAREQEAARQANEKYNYTQEWFPLKRFNAPA